MNLISKKSVYQLTVNEIDELISQLEEGIDFILHDLNDMPKYFKLSQVIGFLIDVRCEKLGIKL